MESDLCDVRRNIFSSHIIIRTISPYLDLFVMRGSDGVLKTKWYTRSSSPGRLLNYRFNHHISKNRYYNKFVSKKKTKLTIILSRVSTKFHKYKILQAAVYTCSYQQNCYGFNKKLDVVKFLYINMQITRSSQRSDFKIYTVNLN